MTDWKPIDNDAIDGGTILVYGTPSDLVIGDNVLVRFGRPGMFTASWDAIDEAFVLSGGSWYGPVINPTHWMPLPDPPSE